MKFSTSHRILEYLVMHGFMFSCLSAWSHKVFTVFKSVLVIAIFGFFPVFFRRIWKITHFITWESPWYASLWISLKIKFLQLQINWEMMTMNHFQINWDCPTSGTYKCKKSFRNRWDEPITFGWKAWNGAEA